MKEKILKLCMLCGIIGPIFYFILLTILGLLWPGYNPIVVGMSEIGAVDSPYQNIMNYFGFTLLGTTMIAFAFGFKYYFRKNIQIIIAFFSLLIGGFAMFLVGFLPCDAKCIDVTIIGNLHSITSTIAAIFISLALIISAYPISKKWGKKWGYLSFYLGIISMVAGPIMFIEALHSYSGLIQRMGIGFSLLWIVLISIKIYKETRA